MDDMYSWIDLFLYSMYLENCNEILNHTYNFMAILHVYTCTRQDIIFLMIFYSINISIFLQNDKYSNTNHIWQKTAEILIDILHFKNVVFHGPIPPRYAAVFWKLINTANC